MLPFFLHMYTNYAHLLLRTSAFFLYMHMLTCMQTFWKSIYQCYLRNKADPACNTITRTESYKILKCPSKQPEINRQKGITAHQWHKLSAHSNQPHILAAHRLLMYPKLLNKSQAFWGIFSMERIKISTFQNSVKASNYIRRKIMTRWILWYNGSHPT